MRTTTIELSFTSNHQMISINQQFAKLESRSQKCFLNFILPASPSHLLLSSHRLIFLKAV